ncbi:MAG: CBS domain-containing protein [Anaerolineae bacterium]|nr:CBS domain-containing protein [Anaerolineae bacterium]
MLVGDRMTREVIVLAAGATVAEGLGLMNERGVHRLPVVDAEGDLQGIVSDMDLRIAEAAGRLADPVSSIMTRRVVTVGEYCPLEEAATLMRRKGVGGLPVVRGNRIIGIITDGDIFDVFAHLLGVGEPGVRLTVAVSAARSTLMTLLNELVERGGDIVGLGTVREKDQRLLVVKVGGLTPTQAQQAVEVAGAELLDLLEEG